MKKNAIIYIGDTHAQVTKALAKLVTFGVGMKLDAAAQHTWCYSVDYQEDKAIFEGQSMTWECWQK